MEIYFYIFQKFSILSRNYSQKFKYIWDLPYFPCYVKDGGHRKKLETFNQLIQRIHFYQQGSLSRAFGLRPRSEKASPSSSSDTGSLASQYMSSARSNSPPPPQLPPRPITGNKRHRRVKSIGDIDYITSAAVSTPVWQEGRPQHSGPYRSLSERGYSSSYSSSQYGSYSEYSNVLHGDQYQYQQTGNYYQLKGGYYSPQSTGPPFPGVQRYGSLAEEAWSCTTKDDSGNPKPSPRTYLA